VEGKCNCKDRPQLCKRICLQWKLCGLHLPGPVAESAAEMKLAQSRQFLVPYRNGGGGGKEQTRVEGKFFL